MGTGKLRVKSMTYELRREQKTLQNDFAAMIAGFANQQTKRRVMAAALTDQDLRVRLAFAGEEDDLAEAETMAAPAAKNEAVRVAALRDRMVEATLRFATPQPAAASKPRFDPLAALEEATKQLADRVLNVTRELLTLPCLSPSLAAASPLDFMSVERQVVLTGEGVRVELQQLPPIEPTLAAKPHLRIVVDASALREPFGGTSGYNTAFVTFEEGEGTPVDTMPIPDRHTLVVSLNAQGRGFMDAVALPTPKAACRLVGITLSHVVHG